MPRQKAGAGVAAPTPVPSTMTANNTTHAGSVNPGVLADREAASIKHLLECDSKDIISDGGNICDDHPSEKCDGQEASSISLNDVYEIIGSDRRRMLIFILAELGREHDGDEEPYIPVGDVAELIAEATPNEDTDRKAVYVTLIQHHLSKLDDAGVINYYERAKKIQPEHSTYLLESILLSIERAIGETTPTGGDQCN